MTVSSKIVYPMRDAEGVRLTHYLDTEIVDAVVTLDIMRRVDPKEFAAFIDRLQQYKNRLLTLGGDRIAEDDRVPPEARREPAEHHYRAR